MDLTRIRYFLAVSETLSFTRAAEQCFISQPALTKGIKKLEENIGGELLVRTKHSVELSELGKTLLPNFRHIHESTDRTHKEAQRVLNGLGNTIRVGVMDTIAIDRVLSMLTAFNACFPSIKIDLVNGSASDFNRHLATQDVDIAITAAPVVGALAYALGETLYTEPYVLAHSDRHRFKGYASISCRDLHDEKYCLYTPCESFDTISVALAQRNIGLAVNQRVTRDDWLYTLIREDHGVSFVPLSVAQAKNIDYVAIADLDIFRVVRYVIPEAAVFMSSVSDLCEYLRQSVCSISPEPA